MAARIDLDALLDERTQAIHRLDDDSIRSLPATTNEQMSDGKTTVTLYHDVLKSGEHRLVVQVCHRVLAGMAGYVGARGFVLTDRGSRRDLEKRELYDFL